jgi:hypothetical protein
MIRCSARAVELLRRSSEAARRFDPDANVRLVPETAGGVRFELAHAPTPGDEIVEHEAGFTLFVASGLSGTVDVTDPHDRLVLISGSDPTGDDA